MLCFHCPVHFKGGKTGLESYKKEIEKNKTKNHFIKIMKDSNGIKEIFDECKIVKSMVKARCSVGIR